MPILFGFNYKDHQKYNSHWINPDATETPIITYPVVLFFWGTYVDAFTYCLDTVERFNQIKVNLVGRASEKEKDRE